MKRQIIITLFAALLSLVSGSLIADDTDIYVGGAPAAGSEPMVMFTLDYRPNLGSTACNGTECDTLIAEGYLPATGPYTFFDVLRAALMKVFEPLDGVKVGLMLNHDNRNNCAGPGKSGCSNGGYIAMGFESFVAGDTNGAKAKFHSILAAMPTPQGNLSHTFQGKELFFEFFRYLTGQDVYNGHNGYTDYAGDNALNLDAEFPAIAWDPTVEQGGSGRYLSPLDGAGTCTKIFTVNPMFQVSSQEDDSNSAIEASVASGGFGSEQDGFVDVIEYLNDADLADGTFGSAPDLAGKQNVTSYFIVDPSKINTTTIGYAQAGNTGQPLPLDEDPDELVKTLQEIFKQILSVSTTFVAASVPVNVFNRAEIVDNVYIALFQADAGAKPYWVGNVKKLRLAGLLDGSGNPRLVDARGNDAIAADGRIRFDALTHWTSGPDLPPPDTDAGEFAGSDGRSVPRGGAGQKLPGFLFGSPDVVNSLAGRKLFFDNGGSLAPLDVNPLTASMLQADLNAADAAEASELIAYARGLDIDDLDGDGNTLEARKWIFADPLHSRPLPINYGARGGGFTVGNPEIYIAVASNDGLLHFIRNTDSGGGESGKEVWAFMPRSVMGVVKTLRANAPGVKHPYAVDGAPVAYMEDSNANGTVDAGERVYVFVGLRRGGKAYYALDVTDPLNPSLLWTIEKSGDFAELGYTFSTPRVGVVDTGTGKRPVLAFAGGYDFNKDTRGSVGTDDAEGNAIFVVDAETGSLVWKAVGSGPAAGNVFVHPALRDSVPSAVSFVDTDGNGLHDRIVVGDTGGNVWRADLKGTNTSDWSLSLLASLGRHASGAGGKADDRRFFHRPDVVLSKDKLGQFDGVVIGSGDRTDPLDKGGSVSNYVYLIKDRNVGIGAGTDTGLEHVDFGDVTDNCLQDGVACPVDLSDGWRLSLENAGEKSLATPFTIGGTVFFTSYLPPGAVSSTDCGPAEGSGRLYAVDLQDATSVNNYDTTDDDLTTEDRYTDLNSGGIPAEVVSVPPDRILRPDLIIEKTNVSTRWRTFWYRVEDSDL